MTDERSNESIVIGAARDSGGFLILEEARQIVAALAAAGRLVTPEHDAQVTAKELRDVARFWTQNRVSDTWTIGWLEDRAGDIEKGATS